MAGSSGPVGAIGPIGAAGASGANCYDGLGDANLDGSVDADDCLYELGLRAYVDPYSGNEWYFTGTILPWTLANTICTTGYRLPTATELQTALYHGLAVNTIDSLPDWGNPSTGLAPNAWADSIDSGNANAVSLLRPDQTFSQVKSTRYAIFCIKS